MSGLGKAVTELIDFVNDEGRVGLSLGLELRIDADVDLAIASAKPASAATLKQERLLLFDHLENSHEERASFCLLAGRHRE